MGFLIQNVLIPQTYVKPSVNLEQNISGLVWSL